MAIYNAGYLSPFKNKLGNAVGRKWRTLDVIAVYNGTPRNPDTEAQKRVRVRMKDISKLAAKCSTFLKRGFTTVCEGTKVPPRAKFIQVNWENVQATSPSVTNISYADLKFSNGGLPVPSCSTADFSNPLQVNVDMTDTSDMEGADNHDIIYMGVINSDYNQFVNAEPVTRSDEQIVAEVPSTWNGCHCHVYVFAVGDGHANKGVTSETVYCGTGTIS